MKNLKAISLSLSALQGDSSCKNYSSSYNKRSSEKALPDLSRRSVQRYIKELIDAGYLKRHEKKDPMGTRLYPTEKVNELLGGAA